MINPSVDPAILDQYRKTAEALLREDGDFAHKALNANGQIVDVGRAGMSDNLQAREELIQQFIKLYKEKVEVLLPPSATLTDPGDKKDVLARIARAVAPPSSPTARVVTRPSTPAAAATRRIEGETKAAFNKYRGLPDVLHKEISGMLDPATRRAVNATERVAASQVQRQFERTFHEACGLCAFCIPSATLDEVRSFTHPEEVVIFKLIRRGADDEFTPSQKKIVIEMAEKYRKDILSSSSGHREDTSIDISIFGAPVRALPPDFAQLFPKVTHLEFKADQFYGRIDMPQLRGLRIKNFGGNKVDFRGSVKLERLELDGVKKRPPLAACKNLPLSVSYLKINGVEILS